MFARIAVTTIVLICSAMVHAGSYVAEIVSTSKTGSIETLKLPINDDAIPVSSSRTISNANIGSTIPAGATLSAVTTLRLTLNADVNQTDDDIRLLTVHFHEAESVNVGRNNRQGDEGPAVANPTVKAADYRNQYLVRLGKTIELPASDKRFAVTITRLDGAAF